MSAWDIAGTVVWTPLAILFWGGALVPSRPPLPPYGAREVNAAVWAVCFSVAAVFCIARLFGAHA